MRVRKNRYGYRMVAFLLALMLTVSDAGMVVRAENNSDMNVVTQSLNSENKDSDDTDPDNADSDNADSDNTDSDNADSDNADSENTDSDDTDSNDTTPDNADMDEEETGEGEDKTGENDIEEEETGEESGEETDVEEHAGISENNLYQDISGNSLFVNAVADITDAPGNVQAKIDWDASCHRHDITWDAVSGAEAYQIQFAIDGNLSPQELTDGDFTDYPFMITEEEPANRVEVSDGRITYHLPISSPSVSVDDKKYVLPIDPDNDFYISGHNYYPPSAQYAVYRVRAMVKDSEGNYQPISEYSNCASANGMYYVDLDFMNKERREKYSLPGTGPYVRFFLGDEAGNEYNMSKPIKLHVGESIDGLTLWAVCEDGTKVSYPQMRDAVKKAEEEMWGVASSYKYPENEFSFIWEISDTLCSENSIHSSDGEISLFYRDIGNTVADKRGLKALEETDGLTFVEVSLNGARLKSSGFPNVWFYVPIQIEAAQEGVKYPELDETPLFFDNAEDLWAECRKKIHNREEEFHLGMTQATYDEFCKKYNYVDDSGAILFYGMAVDEIMPEWVFTQYDEKDWTEPWASENLMDCIAFSDYGMQETHVKNQSYYVLNWSAKYLTTAEQEQELDAKIAELLGEGGALHDAYISDNPLKKIQAAYNYTRGIKWVNGLENPLNYTAYSGIVLRRGSCESSALTFVRLCREMGVQARVVKDDLWGGAGNHGWNIVEYNGLWYYVDCTSGKFMKGSSAYDLSKQLALYRTEPFKSSHPISKSDYALKKVTYYLNGGTNATGNPDVFETGDSLTLAAPSKTGFTFEGWYADSKFKTQITGPEGGTYDTSSLSGNLTLYAKWRVNGYTLSYDMNIPEGAEVKTSAVISDVSVQYNASVKAVANKCVLYKYVFAGWNTMADGTGNFYKAGAIVKNLASEDGAVCRLYAQWTPTTYTVKYDSNGSAVGLSAKGKTAATTMKFYQETNATAANGFTINGYQFTGWNTRADGRGLTFGDTPAEEGASVNGVETIGTRLEKSYAKDTKAVVTLYAQWEPIPYTVKLYANDGSSRGEPVETFTMNIGEALSAKSESNLTRNGYKLVSWNTQANGKGKKYALNAKNMAAPGAEITLYAQWGKPLSYKITYDLQGGKNPTKSPKNPTKYTVESTVEQRTLVKPTKTGYTFVKWVDASAGNPEIAPAITVIPVDACRDIKLRAVWKENSYQVTYHGADERYTGIVNTVTKTYKYTELADAFEPTREYRLKDGMEDKVSISAWTTQPNGKGKSYAVGKGFSKLSAYSYEDEAGRIDLYAKWSTAVYKITYINCSTADGVKNSNAASYTYNARKTVSVKKPTRVGYLFAGWTAPDGKEYFDQVKNCIKAGTAEDVKLTANWTPITYEVKLNLNSKDKGISLKTDAVTVYGSRDGNGIAYNSDSDSFDVQDIVNIPEYYELTGWNTKNNGKGIEAECEINEETGEITSVKLAGLCTKDKGTVTLYAIWKPKSYSITYLNVDPDNKNAEDIVELTGVKVSNPATYTYNASKAVGLKNPTKYGFVFEGWYSDYDAETGEYTNKITSIPKGSYGDITLYGKWRVK